MRHASFGIWASLLSMMVPGARLRFLLVRIGVALLLAGAISMASSAFAQGSNCTYNTLASRSSVRVITVINSQEK